MGDLADRCLAAAGVASGELQVHDRALWLGGALPVDELAVGTVGAALSAAAALAEARTGHRPKIALSAEHAALSFQSERHARRAGAPLGPGFAAVSRLVRCAGGGWARTHGNYPHHARALARALGFMLTGDPDADRAALVEAAAQRTPAALEEAVFAVGGCAVAERTPTEWAAHPAGAAAAGPLITWRDDLAHPAARAIASRARADVARPADGLRVLDLTRVIAGPVAGRTLAALGAEVLRVDPPGLPEIRDQHADTGPGKRATVLDLADEPRREALLSGADVLLCGYRPGALVRFELDAESIAARHPHLVHVSLSAWGEDGPWAARRGFDSLVQVASGIATRCARPDGTPGYLPAQALDHGTGHLIAAAALCSLARRARGEPIAPARLALATTAAHLIATSPPTPADEHTGTADAERFRVAFGELQLIAPPGTLDGTPPRWPHGPRPLGGDEPAWD
jgi:crotonobetainyl-CoA:carnitine CoA-transferase CaiB-like acyl-CoA transferase